MAESAIQPGQIFVLAEVFLFSRWFNMFSII